MSFRVGDNQVFINALREVCGQAPIPGTSDEYKRSSGVSDVFLAWMGNGNFQHAALARGGTGRAPRHEV